MRSTQQFIKQFTDIFNIFTTIAKFFKDKALEIFKSIKVIFKNIKKSLKEGLNKIKNRFKDLFKRLDNTPTINKDETRIVAYDQNFAINHKTRKLIKSVVLFKKARANDYKSRLLSASKGFGKTNLIDESNTLYI